MSINTDILKSFIERIKTITFLQRVFVWKRTRTELIDVASAVSALTTESQALQDSKNALQQNLSDKQKDFELATDLNIRLEETQKRHNELVTEKDNLISNLNNKLTTADVNAKNSEEQVHILKGELALCKERLIHIEEDLKAATKECIELKKEEENRKNEHSNSVATLDKINEQIQKERDDKKEEQHKIEIERLQAQKETWSNHQANVQNTIKTICSRHTIEYVEKVPFKGEPDNTIKICDEYIVFDAKSPGGEDASGFFSYLKTQAEKAKKYTKQENVKPDIYFVIPSNVYDYIKQTVFNLADYNVYFIAVDSLEPIIVSLKKIEAYEFTQQLSPEERENICRIIGKFAHLTKRRIQIDSFFAKQFMEIVYRCEGGLPEDILKDVATYERSERLNPPMEKRAKAINTKQLEADLIQLDMELGNKGISIDDLSEGLNSLKLYNEEK